MKYNVTIDRLRGVCVLAVVCMHYLFFYPNVLIFLGAALGNGYYGVTAFFCTSGFLITTNMLRRYDRVAKVDLYAFYVMRFSRIAPPLALLCLVLGLLSMTTIKSFVFPPSLSLKDTLINIVTFRYNIYYRERASIMPVWAVLWSLSIEEMFYLAYPLIAKVTRSTQLLVAILVAVAIYAPLHRLSSPLAIYDYFGCFDGIAMGALAALAARRFGGGMPKLAAWAFMVIGIAIAGCSYAKTDVHVQYNLGLTLVALGAAVVLFASQCAPFAGTRPWAYDPLTYLGRLSYEMYLFHMTIFALLSDVVMPRFVQHPKAVFAAIFVCVIAASDVIARFYAEPLNRWLRTHLLSLRKQSAAEPVPVHEPLVLSPSPGIKLMRLVLVLLLCAQLVYTVRKLAQASPAWKAFAEAVLPVKYYIGPPDIVIHNPQGTDGEGNHVWYWIGPDATIELIDHSPPGSAARSFSLMFHAGAGPSNSDPARELVLLDANGNEQKFGFVNNATVHFDVRARPGKNVYTLRVASPTKMTLVIPTDPRDLMVGVDQFALADLPPATPAASIPAPPKAAQ